MKHVFLVNPAAGQKKAPLELVPEIQRVCTEAEVNFDIRLTRSAADIVEFTASQAASGAHIRFYACGGDGTLNQVLCGLVGYPNAELAYVPYGTGNDFSRNFENEPVFRNIQKQLAGTPQALDVIRAGDTYSINMINIGVDCDVVAEAAKLKESPLLKGSLAYAVGAVKVLARGKTYRMRIEFDDGEVVDEELFLIGVANGSYCGGGFRSAPHASLADGAIDVCIIRPVRGIEVIRLLAAYRKGTHLANPRFAPHIVFKTCTHLSIEAREPVNVSIDGEITSFDRMTCDVLPGAVQFSVPEGACRTNA